MKITVITDGVKRSQNISVSNRVSGKVNTGAATKDVDVHSIPGFPGYYANVKTGQIYGRRGKSIGSKNPAGYVVCSLKNSNGESKNMLRSRLIIMAATNSEIENDMEVDHINNIKHDDRIENLAKCSHKDNCNNKLTSTLRRNRSYRISCDKLTITAPRAQRTYNVERAE